MYYICNMRTIIRSTEFDEFYNSLPANVQNKVKYAMNILAEYKGPKYQVGKETC